MHLLQWEMCEMKPMDLFSLIYLQDHTLIPAQSIISMTTLDSSVPSHPNPKVLHLLVSEERNRWSWWMGIPDFFFFFFLNKNIFNKRTKKNLYLLLCGKIEWLSKSGFILWALASISKQKSWSNGRKTMMEVDGPSSQTIMRVSTISLMQSGTSVT